MNVMGSFICLPVISVVNASLSIMHAGEIQTQILFSSGSTGSFTESESMLLVDQQYLLENLTYGSSEVGNYSSVRVGHEFDEVTQLLSANYSTPPGRSCEKKRKKRLNTHTHTHKLKGSV